MSPILQSLANGSARGYGAFVPLGAAGAFESIASATGTGSSGTITFSSIPNTYQSLQLRIFAICTVANVGLRVQVNSLTSNAYTYHLLSAGGASITQNGTGLTGGSNMTIGYYQYSDTNYPQACIMNFEDYANTSRLKTVRQYSGASNATSPADVTMQTHYINTTNAISTISVFYSTDSFKTSSTVSLYGIKG